MHNYQQILKMAHKQGVKLTNFTMRKDFCVMKIKRVKIIGWEAYFSTEDVDSYIEAKKALKIGRPTKEFDVKGITYKSENDFIERTGQTRSTACYWKNKQKQVSIKSNA